MCGIAGIIKRKGRTLSETDHRTVDRMVALMHHRGPDATGTWENPESTCLFGHARLSIIDLVGSPQPMVADSDAITYNGELYNYRELRRLLEARGRAFRTGGDTEVLLQSLREWGSTAVDEFDGMYAVGFWENKSQRLLLLRDPFGIKPLFYAFAEECLAFASELTALSAVPGVDRGLASDSLVEKAQEILRMLQPHLTTQWDDRGNVGNRYRYQDEQGTPWCITVDFETLGEKGDALKDTVTVRDRDTMKQERVKITDLVGWFKARL